MKKLLSIFLIIALLFTFCSCSKQDGKTSEGSDKKVELADENVEKIAKEYLELLFNRKFVEADEKVVYDAEVTLREINKIAPDDIQFDGDKITIDGMTFDNVKAMIKAMKEEIDEFSLAKAEHKSTKKITGDDLKEFKENVSEIELADAIMDDLGDDALSTLVSVDFDVIITHGEGNQEGIVSVYLVKMDGEWKILSPSWTSWLLMAFPTLKQPETTK